MAVTIDSNYCNADEIDTTIEALITAATITTFHNTIVARIGGERFYVAIVYE